MTSETPDGLAPLPDLGGDMAPMGDGLPDLAGDLPAMGADLPAMGSDMPAMGSGLPPLGNDLPPMGGDLPPLGNDLPPIGAAPSALSGTAPNMTSEAPLSERREDGEGAQYKRSIYALPVNLQVVIGTARPTIAELLKMKAGSLVTLGSKIEDPVDLCIDNRVIARGELVETDPATGGIGVRLTEIVDISEDMLA